MSSMVGFQLVCSNKEVAFTSIYNIENKARMNKFMNYPVLSTVIIMQSTFIVIGQEFVRDSNTRIPATDILRASATEFPLVPKPTGRK